MRASSRGRVPVIRGTLASGLLAACLLLDPRPAAADSPLVMPAVEKGPPLMTTAEAAAVKREAEALKRKADFLKAAATKKYAESADLRRKAGGHRTEASRKGEALRSKAEASAALSNDLGEMFGLLTSIGGGMSGLTGDRALTASVTGKLIQGQQAADAKGVAAAHGEAAQLESEAERKAGPLEQRADELENEGNRLMQANNRLMGIVNARFLLVAADELARKVDADGRQLERLRATQRALLASPADR